AAAVAMLEPLMLEPSADGSPVWVGAMAQRSAALGGHARALGLQGIAFVADLVRHRLLAADHAAAAPDMALAGQWARGLIAFVGLQLDAEGRRSWLEDLGSWLARAERLDDAALARLDRLLAADHARLAHWRDAPAEAGAGPEGAGDELVLLAEACAELEDLLQPVLAAWCADGQCHCADSMAVGQAIEEFTDRLGHFGAALGFVGLDAVGALLVDSAAAITGMRDDPAAAPVETRQALLAWPTRWEQAFRRNDDASIDAALAL